MYINVSYIQLILVKLITKYNSYFSKFEIQLLIKSYIYIQIYSHTLTHTQIIYIYIYIYIYI